MTEWVAWFDSVFVEIAVVDVETFGEGILDLEEFEAADVEAVGVVGFLFYDGVWEMTTWREFSEEDVG